jgi:hypothetical protein
MRNRFFVPVLFGILLIGLVGLIANTVIGSVKDKADREYRIVIPEGTGERIENGETVNLVPAKIELVLGEKDILVIENQDSVGHTVGDFWVGAGETLRQEFKTEATYQGQCTIHETAQIEIVVSDKG